MRVEREEKQMLFTNQAHIFYAADNARKCFEFVCESGQYYKLVTGYRNNNKKTYHERTLTNTIG
jgi:hypothetical protein